MQPAGFLEGQLQSFTFYELAALLDKEAAAVASADVNVATPIPTLEPQSAQSTAEADSATTDALALEEQDEVSDDPMARLEQQIEGAEWLIFAMLDVDPIAHPESDVVKRFLRERSEQLEGKQLIVLSLHAPYFLDATEISNLSAYLGVYSRSQPFLENAVRAIFRTFIPTGAPSVSVPGTRFDDLARRLEANLEHPIDLRVFVDEVEIASNSEPLEEPASRPEIAPGSSLRLQIGPILDRNGHLVPDGTPVSFNLTYEIGELSVQVPESMTRNGLAVSDIVLEQSGVVQIGAISGDATSGEPVIVVVSDDQPAQVVTPEQVSQPVGPLSETDNPTVTVDINSVDSSADGRAGKSRCTRSGEPGKLLLLLSSQ